MTVIARDECANDPAAKGSLRVGLFSLPPLAYGGGFEEYLIRLASSLTKRGHQVIAINASPREYRALQLALNIYYRNPLLRNETRASTEEVRERLGDAALLELPVRKMASALRQCDVVYAKNELLELSVLRALRTARLPPIICGVHTPMWYARAQSLRARLHNALYLGRVYRRLLSGVSAIHVSNAYDASLFPRAFGLSPDRVVRIPHPFVVDVERPKRRRPSVYGDRVRVLWAGRLTEQKGVDTLAKVIAKINRSSADSYTFEIAGSGDRSREEEVSSLAMRYDNVRYLGHVRHGEMHSLYEKADAALVTSNWETFPYSCLEPQALGVPVVASDIPGCADIIEHGVTGYLFPAGDIDRGAQALSEILKLRQHEPETLVSMGRRAIARVRERNDPQAITDVLERMLLTVARQGQFETAARC